MISIIMSAIAWTSKLWTRSLVTMVINCAEPNVELYSTVPSTQSEQIYGLAGMTSGTVVVQVAQGDLGADMGDVVADGGYQGLRR